jgi:uncharacterized protein YxeA
MKKTLIIIALLIVELGFAQLSIKKSSVDSGGTVVTNSSITIIQTIGEVVVQENTTGTLHISEGFISPDMQSVLAVDNYASLEGVTIFPNPTIDFVKIHFMSNSNYFISLTDSSGKQIAAYNTIETNQYSLDMTSYSSGIYLVLVKDLSKQLYKVYKIVKK